MDELAKQIIMSLGVAAIVAFFAYLMLQNLISHQKELMDLIRTELKSVLESSVAIAAALQRVADQLEDLTKK